MPNRQPGKPKTRQWRAAPIDRETVGVLLCFGGLFVALLVVAIQALSWLQTGHWPSLTMATLLVPLISGTPLGSWLAEPQSWYGLQKVAIGLLGLPLSVWIAACGLGASWVLLK